MHSLNKKRCCNEKLNPTAGLRWQSKMPRSSYLILSLLPFKERPKRSDSAWMAPVLWKAYHLLGGQENAGCALWRRENIIWKKKWKECVNLKSFRGRPWMSVKKRVKLSAVLCASCTYQRRVKVDVAECEWLIISLCPLTDSPTDNKKEHKF